MIALMSTGHTNETCKETGQEVTFKVMISCCTKGAIPSNSLNDFFTSF